VKRRTVAAALALACAAVCVPRALPAAETLHVATTPIDLGAQVLYAKDRGYFAKAGLDVDVQLISSGAAIASAVAGGALDIAQANLVSLAAAHERGLPFVIVAPAGLYTSTAPTTHMLVAKNASFKSGKDLDGKTIAVNGILNISQIGGMAWIEATGGDLSTVHFIEMPFPQMGAALEAGRIDAAVVAEPEASAAMAATGARIIGEPYTAIAKRFLIGAWFATSSWAKAHPDAVKRFVEAVDAAGTWANAHHAESAKILETYTKITLGPNAPRTTYTTKLDAKEITPLLDAAAKYKAIKAPISASDLLLK
jgi:NitT/TauT family transport system substrate-binding protein